MKKDHSLRTKIILVLVLFVLLAIGNASGRTDVENKVLGEIVAQESIQTGISLAEIQRLIRNH